MHIRNLIRRLFGRVRGDHPSPVGATGGSVMAAADWYRASVDHADAGRHHEAVDAARRCLSLDQGHLKAWGTLAASLAKCGQYRDAVDAARQAIALGDDRVSTRRVLAISHEQLADVDAARLAWQQVEFLKAEAGGPLPPDAQKASEAAREKPWSEHVWRKLATSYGREGRDDEAVGIAEAALSEDPSLHAAVLPLVETVLNRTPDAAWRLLRKMLAAAPGNAHYMHLCGVAGAKAGKGEGAFELIRESTRQMPQEPSYWYALGRALEDADNEHHQEALAAFARALALKPNYAKARTHRERLQTLQEH